VNNEVLKSTIEKFEQKKSHSSMKGSGSEIVNFVIASFTPSLIANAAAHHTHLHHAKGHHGRAEGDLGRSIHK
jgi:hypothetical protein